MLGVQPQVVERYVKAGKVNLVFRDVLNHGDRSLRASEAAACAGAQGQFYQMHALLFQRMNDTWATSGNENLNALMTKWFAELPGGNREAFGQCLAGNNTLAALRTADAEQRKRGIVSQPIFEIVAGNKTQRLIGGQPHEVFARSIDAVLP